MKVAFAEFRDGVLYDCETNHKVENIESKQLLFMNPYVVYFIADQNETKQEELKFITEWITQRYSNLPKICNMSTVIENLNKPKQHSVYSI